MWPIARARSGDGPSALKAFTLAEALDAAESADEVWDRGLATLAEFGIDKAIWMDASGPRAPALRSNCPEGWLRSYAAKVADGDDPFVTYCLASARPIRTGVSYLPRHDYLTRSEKDLIADASAATGTRSGVAVTTMRDRAGWNLMADMDAPEFETLFAAHGAEMMLCAQMIHAALATGVSAPTALSDRERDCLTYVALGARTGEIAALLGLAEVTVEMHLRHARQRLGARTRDEAVARALVTRAIRI